MYQSLDDDFGNGFGYAPLDEEMNDGPSAPPMRSVEELEREVEVIESQLDKAIQESSVAEVGRLRLKMATAQEQLQQARKDRDAALEEKRKQREQALAKERKIRVEALARQRKKEKEQAEEAEKRRKALEYEASSDGLKSKLKEVEAALKAAEEEELNILQDSPNADPEQVLIVRLIHLPKLNPLTQIPDFAQLC